MSMEFRIPFTFTQPAKLEKLKKRAQPFRRLVKQKKNTVLGNLLSYDQIPLTREEYLAICLRTAVYVFLIIMLLLGFLLMVVVKLRNALLLTLLFAFIIALFVFATQRNYPRLHHARRQRNIEKNLLPALQDMLVQLDAGIPLFNILVNLSAASYGELSQEFKKTVAHINAGEPQIEVIEKVGEQNESPYFRRMLWQLSNGMRAGSDIALVIRESVRSLQEEQLIQIQNYGNKLNPLIMFYMLISVIIPALSVAFLTILSSLIGLPAQTTRFLFISFFVLIILVQVMFVGLIRSVRPSLL